MNKKSFGTHAVAEMCQVTPPTIIRWIKDGNLPCFETLGGHRRVWDTDLLAFLKSQNMPIPEELQHLSSRQILIVDDEDSIRKVVRIALKKFYPDAEIHEASNGFEAGHKVAQLTPALVILDLKLPGIDGFKICQIIRSDQRLRNTRILGISGHYPETSKKQALTAGMDDFLPKPFSVDQLQGRVAQLFQNGN